MANPYESPDSPESLEEPIDANLVQSVPCPYCGEPMEHGVVVPTGFLYWLEKDERRTILPPSAKLPNTGPGLLRPNRLSSLRCRCCEVVLVQHQKKSANGNSDG